MDTNLTQVLVEILSDVKNGVAAEWPEVARQAVEWEFIASVVFSVIGLTLITLAWKLAPRLFKKAEEAAGGAEVGYGLAGGALVIGMVIGVIMFPGAVHDAIKVKVAPKLYLVEKFTGK